MRKHLIPSIVSATLLLTSCSAGIESREEDSDLDITHYDHVTAVFDRETMDIVLPLDRYTKTVTESGISSAVRSMQYAECSEKRLGIQVLDEGPQEFSGEFNYGIWDKSFAARHGYDTIATVQTIDTDGFLPAGKNTPEENQKILECEDQVKEYGDFPYGAYESGTAAAEADFQSQSAWSTDEDVQKWRGEWADCLEDQGYHIDEDSNPWQPTVDGDDKEAQIRTALADVQCKESTGAFQKIMDRRAQYQQAAIDQHKTELTEYRRKLDQEMQEARDLLAEHGITVPAAKKAL